MISRCSAAIAFASGDRLVEVLDQNDRAEIVPRGPRDVRARQRASCDCTARSTSSASAALSVIRIDCALTSCSACASRSAAIQPALPVSIGDHQHFRGAGDHVDADLAEHQPLGGGDIGIAGADDLGHRRDGRGAIGQRRHRLRAADAVDFGDAAEMRRRQHQRIELAVRRRHHHHHARRRRRPWPAPRSSAPRTDRRRCRREHRGRPPRSRSSASRVRRRARR